MNPADRVNNQHREAEVDPFPAATAPPTFPLTVDSEDAKRHLPLLVRRSETGEQIILTRRGHPVAHIVAIVP